MKEHIKTRKFTTRCELTERLQLPASHRVWYF